MVKRIVYCETCERNIVLRRKQFEHVYHEVLCLLTFMSFGLAYVILKYMKKKDTCPNCQSKFDLKNLPPARELEEGITV
jgi:hypothetical protein